MSIVFLVAFEESPYSGVVRPFINWAKALRDRAIVAVYGCSNHLESYVSNAADLNGFKFVGDKNFQGLVAKLNKNSIEYYFSDDYIPRVKLLLKAQDQIKAKCAVYTQILYGTHSIAKYSKDLLDLKTKLVFSAASAVPFKLVSSKYKSLLGKVDVVIASSIFTASMLNLVYGVGHAGVVYPPINIDVFRPSSVKPPGKEVLIYLGSGLGDTDPKLVQRLVSELNNDVSKVHLLGNERMYQKYLNHGEKLVYHKGLEDRELAEIYSRVSLTIAPQTIEFFGLVPLESLSCGTPVLTRYPHEALLEGTVGQVAYNDGDMTVRAKQLLAKPTDEKLSQKCREIATRFSIEHSTFDLLRILKLEINT
ncbi:MAG: glycosyltransferase [Thermoprotei archaeon]